MTTALAAMAVIGTIGSAGAQHVRVFDGRGYILLGFIHGEMLRFTVGNMRTPEEVSEPAHAQVKLYDAQGYVLAQSEEVAL